MRSLTDEDTEAQRREGAFPRAQTSVLSELQKAQLQQAQVMKGSKMVHVTGRYGNNELQVRFDLGLKV